VLCFSALASATAGTTYTFTNSGATGREGPTQSQINTNYSGTNLANSVTINTRGIQEWTVPASGDYRLEAFGAQGGNGFGDDASGGLGAKVEGIFSLTSGQTIKILVGQRGGNGLTSLSGGGSGGGGGGGGSFIFYSVQDALPILSAGGGGGAHGPDKAGSNASISTSGVVGNGSTGTSGRSARPPGANGSGGGAGSDHVGGGGAGWLSNGETPSRNNAQYDGTGGLAPRNGGTGGSKPTAQSENEGGFGGGGSGGSSDGSGAGGGGFSGGSSGNYMFGGGGGGSYNSGTDQNNTAGFNSGHGQVVIKYLGSSASPLDIGLVAWYPLDGNGTDHSVTANHATVHGATPTADRHGVAGKALLFDGSNDYLEAAFNQTVSSSAFTYSVWAKPTSTTTHHGSVITSRDIGQGFLLYKMPDNTWDFWVSKNSGWLKVHGQAITFNWTAFALSYDGSTYNFYKNGSLLSSETGTYQPNTSKPLRIGAGRTESTANYFFKGVLDEVRIWNRGLSTSEITSLYSMEKPANNPPTELNSTSALAFSENQPAGTVVGEFNATDSDSGSSLSYHLVSGTGDGNNSLFILDANGTLKTLHSFDYETNTTSHSIRLRVTDEHNASLEGNFTIALLNQIEDLDGDGTEDHYDSDDDGDGFSDSVETAYGSDPRDPNSVANVAPNALGLNDSNFSENQPAGTIVGEFNATDPDANATLTFSLLSGSNLFSLDSNGTLRTLHSLDFETNSTSYAISVRVTDEHNTSLEGNFTIALLDDPSDNQSPENNATGAANPDGNQTTVDQNATASAWWEADADSGNGWRASPWLGSFRPYSNGWIYHLGLGWAYAQPDEMDGLWLWMPNEQWVWSAPHCWPHVWKHSSSNWLYFVKEHEGKPALYDYSTEFFRWK